MTQRRPRLGRPPMKYPIGIDKPNAFSEWVAKHDVSIEELAKILGKTKHTIYRWRRGGKKGHPDLSTAITIERLSDGEVPVSSWSV